MRFSHQESVPVEGCDRRRWPGLQRVVRDFQCGPSEQAPAKRHSALGRLTALTCRDASLARPWTANPGEKTSLMYGAGDVRVEELSDAKLEAPTDAVVRVVRACVCGSDLHPYHSMPASAEGTPMGHEFIGVAEEVGSEVATIRRGDFVIAPFAYFDNTCVFCREGLSTSCEHQGRVKVGNIRSDLRSWSTPAPVR